ncbi:MAG: helix-turn-helix domain-containing protein [Candidatus Competibacteraceae bacterium]|nr:helix-turn-helix domain-containing protein [Candidatus Competibacteraceae bacterium]
MSVSDRVSGGFRDIPASNLTPDLRAQAETLLQVLLAAEGLPDRGVYRPGEICRLLRISPTTLRQFCELAEHPAVRNPDPRALQSFKVGCHHRIAHAALVEWLARNQTFQRDAE